MKLLGQLCCYGLGVLMTGALGQPSQASETLPLHTIRVTGVGEVRAQPGSARLRVGVTTHALMAQAAMENNAQTMRGVLQGLAELGIAPHDIQTGHLTVAPQYQQRHTGQPVAPGIVGYQVQHTVAVTVRDVSRVGEILDRLLQLGVNHLDEVQLLIADEAALLDQARVAAVHEARRKAELFGQAAGVVVGQVVSIDEVGGSSPPPRPMRRMQAAASIPIALGEQTLQVRVTVMFALRQK